MVFRRFSLNAFMFGVLAFSPVAYAEAPRAFEAYKAQQSNDFQQYIADQKQAFAAYKKAYQAAYQDYTKEISRHWSRPETSTPKKWVAYDDHYQQKTTVDFSTGQVTITQLVEDYAADQAKIEARLKRKLASLNELTYQQAYHADPVAVKVDSVIKKQVAPTLVAYKPAPAQKIPLFASQPDVKRAQVSVGKQKDKQAVTLTYQLKTKDVSARVKKVLPDVLAQAKRQGMPPALVLALIKNESAFNPMAKSHIPAYGLMQIVPKSAGKDATQYLFKESKLLSASYLYTPDKNIEVGVAYLYILYNRYLKRIEDPKSRLYCTIAAYNTGAGNVAKSYVGSYSVNRAAPLINKQSPDQVYAHLIKNLPYDETRKYLKKVNASYNQYQKMFN